MKEAGVEQTAELSFETKRSLSGRFQYSMATVEKWFFIENELRKLFATSRPRRFAWAASLWQPSPDNREIEEPRQTTPAPCPR